MDNDDDREQTLSDFRHAVMRLVSCGLKGLEPAVLHAVDGVVMAEEGSLRLVVDLPFRVQLQLITPMNAPVNLFTVGHPQPQGKPN